MFCITAECENVNNSLFDAALKSWKYLYGHFLNFQCFMNILRERVNVA